MTGDTLVHLVKYFVTVIIYLAIDLLVDRSIGPMKYISHFSKSCSVTCEYNDVSSLLDGFQTL
jgi:hypothetical protein